MPLTQERGIYLIVNQREAAYDVQKIMTCLQQRKVTEQSVKTKGSNLPGSQYPCH